MEMIAFTLVELSVAGSGFEEPAVFDVVNDETLHAYAAANSVPNEAYEFSAT
jgi:hypothetical protein